MFINIHSHFPAKNNEWVLQSFYKDFENLDLPEHFSAGLHPWYLQTNYLQDLGKLELLAQSEKMLAVGECGLDKVCSTDMGLQLSAFEKQIQLANEVKKPLIIHCVRAYDEVLATLENMKNETKVVFHGFNKSKELALQLTNKGYYLSFGSDVQKPKVAEFIKDIPLTQICLETDNSTVSIESVYSMTAEAYNISLEHLISQIQKNAENLLSIKL